MARRTGAALALCLALAAVPLAADEFGEGEARHLTRIVDITRVDILPDTPGDEIALLARGRDDSDMADLIVLDGFDRTPLFVRRGLVFAGPMAGQEALFSPRGNGSIAVVAGNTGIGRTAWDEVLTLAHRDGALRVAGYSHVAYDRIDNASASCDVNLLTGGWETTVSPAGGTAVARSGKGVADAPPVADWSPEDFPRPCAEALEAAGLN
ncbi:hypothetical protein E2L08_09045 [Palleronia sediminis]|uniref:Uncharacterized protein n=1 Tax=Palleronia sediminis TaxID=2547833 RepID=A0A4V6PP67_9RHOB|nr:hypothetical protein [Palleronia sediminis]TDL79739.1 hypothetical protein E2L08_09045 [Palleronia sediminis]